MAASVVVVGDALLDVLAAPSEPMRPGADVPAAVRVGPGGQGANLAIRLARLGLEVELFCATGADAAGKVLLDSLAGEGVHVRSLSAEATGAVVVLVDEAGERTMLSRRVPIAGSPDLSSAAADWLVVSGYVLLEREAEAVAARLAGWAPRRALVGCAVPDAVLGAWQGAAEALAPDVVILNRDEADRLPSLARDRRVVTDAEGASAVIAGVRATAVTPPGPPATDTTGAGDAFAAAFLHQLFARWPPSRAALERALLAGAAAGAAAARRLGAQGRIPGERSGKAHR